MTPLRIAGAVLFVAGLIGFAWWMLSRLFGALREERTRRGASGPTISPTVAALALAVYIGLALLTDYRTALTLALIGLAVAVAVERIKDSRRRTRK